MRTRALCAFGGVGVCIFVTALWAAAPAEKPKTTWEYKFVTTQGGPSDPTWSDGPNALGAEGWELVSATADAKDKYVLYYKRAK